MLENGKTDPVLRKSYEISYALWRIAANIKKEAFSAKLADKAIDLINCAADGNTEAIETKLQGIELLVKFGVDVNCIGIGNGEILAKEIGNLKSAIFDMNAANSLDELVTPGKEYDVEIADIFGEEFPESKIENFHSEEPEVLTEPAEKTKSQSRSTNVIAKAENRQTAILERIRQIGNCRLNDIQAILPDCSERTIRYDLESLVQKNLVERVGTGGRSVYYRLPIQ